MSNKLVYQENWVASRLVTFVVKERKYLCHNLFHSCFLQKFWVLLLVTNNVFFRLIVVVQGHENKNHFDKVFQGVSLCDDHHILRTLNSRVSEKFVSLPMIFLGFFFQFFLPRPSKILNILFFCWDRKYRMPWVFHLQYFSPFVAGFLRLVIMHAW